jgi:hypothetical protein
MGLASNQVCVSSNFFCILLFVQCQASCMKIFHNFENCCFRQQCKARVFLSIVDCWVVMPYHIVEEHIISIFREEVSQDGVMSYLYRAFLRGCSFQNLSATFLPSSPSLHCSSPSASQLTALPLHGGRVNIFFDFQFDSSN